MYRRASRVSTGGNQKKNTTASVNKRRLPVQTSSHLFLLLVRTTLGS